MDVWHKVCEFSRSKCSNVKQKRLCNFVKEPMYGRQRQLRENKLMRLYAFASPISNVITLKLFLDLGIWSLVDFFSPYLLTICFSDALGQDEDVNTYINGSTWSIGDCIDCYCHNGVVSCSRTLSVITSNDTNTDNCSQPDCDVAAFLKANRGICKGKWLWR